MLDELAPIRKPERAAYTPLDFLTWRETGGLIVAPEFQRRAVWGRPAKAFLIDTLLRGLPVPPLYLRVRQSDDKTRTIREVIDGQQRRLRGGDSFVHEVRRSIRQGIDEVIDGRRTRRRAYSELSPPEKSFCGIRIESALVTNLELPPGAALDASFDGVDVDIKASSVGNWMIGPKQIGGLLLLLAFSEKNRVFSVGLVRGHRKFMNPSKNRDAKRTLNRYAKNHIRWIAKDEELPVSVLSSLTRAAYDDIFQASARAERIKRLAKHLPFYVPFPRRVLEIVVGGNDPLRGTRADAAFAGRGKHPLGAIRIASFQTNGSLKELGLPVLARGEHMKVRARDLARAATSRKKRAKPVKRVGASAPGARSSKRARRTARGAKGRSHGRLA